MRQGAVSSAMPRLPTGAIPKSRSCWKTMPSLCGSSVGAFTLLGEEPLKAAAQKGLDYLRTNLWFEDLGVFGGSQFADAEYYAQPAEERKEWNPPPVDETVLTGGNAAAVRALVAWWQITGEAEALVQARRVMDFLLANLVTVEGVPVHFQPAEGEEAARPRTTRPRQRTNRART